MIRVTKLERNSNIELLRIVLMFMVILLHFNNGTMGGAFNYVTDNTINSFILYLLESFSICAVNCFMIISGYFLAFNKTVKLSKIFDLLFVVILYRLFDYFLSIGLGYNDFSINEISETLNIPSGTVKSRLAKAREILKSKLENKEV